MVGGPLGALFGAAVGHNWEAGRKSAGRPEALSTERAHAAFLAATFQLMGYVAKADGRVSEPEIAVARAMMERLKLNPVQRQSAVDCFTEGKQAQFTVETALDRLRQVSRGQSALAQRLVVMLLNLGYADGDLHTEAQRRILAIATAVGVNRLQFEAMHTLLRAQRWAQEQAQGGPRASSAGGGSYYSSQGRRSGSERATGGVQSLSQAYALLGVKANASPEQIKLAYRRLLQRHHPDKLAAANSTPEQIIQATEKTREITAAYEWVRTARGFA